MKPKRVVADTKYPNMYRLEYDDGKIFHEMYNKTRALDILKHYGDYVAAMAAGDALRNSSLRSQPRKPADALE